MRRHLPATAHEQRIADLTAEHARRLRVPVIDLMAMRQMEQGRRMFIEAACRDRMYPAQYRLYVVWDAVVRVIHAEQQPKAAGQ